MVFSFFSKPLTFVTSNWVAVADKKMSETRRIWHDADCDMWIFREGSRSHGNARLTKLRSERGKENARIKFFPSAVSRTCFIIRYDAFQKNSPANRDLSTNLDIWILLFSSFSLTIAEFNENRGCFFMCLFLRFLQRYEEKPPPGQFFQSTVLILGHFLFFPVNSLINSLFSRENKIALLYAAVTTQRVSWACVPIHFSHISAQVKLQQITVCGVTGIINDNACVYNHFVRKKRKTEDERKIVKNGWTVVLSQCITLHSKQDTTGLHRVSSVPHPFLF